MKSFNEARLRAMEPEDLELIYRIENDPTFWQHGTTTVPYSRYAIRQYLESAQNDIFKDGQVRLVIEAREGRSEWRVERKDWREEAGLWRTVGLADLCNFDALHLRAEIGLAILPEFQSQGLGEVAMRQLEAYAQRLNLHQLYAVIASGNQPANRLFQRLNYQSSTRLRDWLRQGDTFTDALVWQKILS